MSNRDSTVTFPCLRGLILPAKRQSMLTRNFGTSVLLNQLAFSLHVYVHVCNFELCGRCILMEQNTQKSNQNLQIITLKMATLWEIGNTALLFLDRFLFSFRA